MPTIRPAPFAHLLITGAGVAVQELLDHADAAEYLGVVTALGPHQLLGAAALIYGSRKDRR